MCCYSFHRMYYIILEVSCMTKLMFHMRNKQLSIGIWPSVAFLAKRGGVVCGGKTNDTEVVRRSKSNGSGNSMMQVTSSKQQRNDAQREHLAEWGAAKGEVDELCVYIEEAQHTCT